MSATPKTDSRTPPAFKPIRARRAFEEVANQVLEMISSGELRPGDKLPSEREFSRQLEVSRSALREALRTLEQSGVLDLRKGKSGGAFISTGERPFPSNPVAEMFRLGSVSLSELTEARIWMVDTIVRVACSRATAADFRKLEENMALAEQLFGEGHFEEKSDVNIEFHNLLARATRNPVLITTAGMLNEVLRGFARHLGPEISRRTFKARRRFMDALRARQPELAVKEMQDNLQKTHRVYVRLARAAKREQGAVPAVKRRVNGRA